MIFVFYVIGKTMAYLKKKNSVQLDKLCSLAYELEDRLCKITSSKIKEYENNLKKNMDNCDRR